MKYSEICPSNPNFEILLKHIADGSVILNFSLRTATFCSVTLGDDPLAFLRTGANQMGLSSYLRSCGFHVIHDWLFSSRERLQNNYVIACHLP